MAITVAYERKPGFPKERITNRDIEVVDKLKCAYDDRITLVKELLGFTVGGTIQLAHEFDFGDDPIANIFCRDVQVEPLMGLSGETYTHAWLTVTYENRTYDQPETGIVYVTEAIEPASEFLTLPYEKVYWSDDVVINAGESPSKLMRMSDWVYTIHYAASIPSWVWTHPGTVNNATVYSRQFDRNFPAETLLCGNPSMAREITSEGTTAWTLTIRFTYKAEGWNKFPRTDKTTNKVLKFENIYKATGGADGDLILCYETSNFTSIVI